MRHMGIRAEGVRVLRALSQHAEPIASAVLADELQVTTQNVRKMLNKCASLGLVDAVLKTTYCL